uniref:Putative insulin-like protein growth factor binding protein n=1 Tax=Tityus obscurus TaxID=1221240 RepID=A0A1E1WVN4_TITOB
MNKLFLCVFLCTIICVNAHKCPRCEETVCSLKQRKDCPAGIVKDYCKCCMICGKGLNEKCGGIRNISGICGKGLVCKVPDNSSDNTGICKKA